MRTAKVGRHIAARPYALATALILSACRDQPAAPEPLSDPRGLILAVTTAYPAEIHVMRPDGSDRRQLTRDAANDLHPHWAPDGRTIVFSRAQDSMPGTSIRRPDIYVMNADGSGMRPIYQGSAAYGPRWSPDGRTIAFVREDAGIGRRVYLINPDGTDIRLVTSEAHSIAPDWTPDGARLLFLGTRPERPARSIYTIRANATDEQLVGGDAVCVGNVQEARWSPDGTRIAYRCDDAPGGAIFIINADATARVRLTPESTGPHYIFDTSPVWSPDGAQIAFMSNRQGSGAWVMDATGANATRIRGQGEPELVPTDWGAVPQ